MNYRVLCLSLLMTYLGCGTSDVWGMEEEVEEEVAELWPSFQRGFENLPPYVQQQILESLSWQDLGSLAQTSKAAAQFVAKRFWIVTIENTTTDDLMFSIGDDPSSPIVFFQVPGNSILTKKMRSPIGVRPIFTLDVPFSFAKPASQKFEFASPVMLVVKNMKGIVMSDFRPYKAIERPTMIHNLLNRPIELGMKINRIRRLRRRQQRPLWKSDKLQIPANQTISFSMLLPLHGAASSINVWVYVQGKLLPISNLPLPVLQGDTTEYEIYEEDGQARIRQRFPAQ